MSYIFGLNQFPEGEESGQYGSPSAQTNQLLAGLNALPSASDTNSPEENMSSIANQLALWTNANFSFDGPTGHALLGEDDKEGNPEKEGGHGRDDEEDRAQRRYAASSAHSNAARDKNREPGMEPPAPAATSPQDVGSSAPQPAANGSMPAPPAPWGSGVPGAQPPHTPSTSPWDLTSTLALQYLLSRNQAATAGLPNMGAAQPPPPPPAVPSPGVPFSGMPFPGMGEAFPDGNRGAHAGGAPPSYRRTSPNARASGAEQKRAESNKRSVSSLYERSASPARPNGPGKAGASEEKAEEHQDEARASHDKSRAQSVAERVKLVDTGNPEADAETNRLAIEEDKRRRNTAASARFRIKKKQREAALEMSARELEGQVAELRQENERLRTENEWLKRLIRPEGVSTGLSSGVPQQAYLVTPPTDMRAHEGNVLGTMAPGDDHRLR